MIKKMNIGDLILDYSQEGIESIGYINGIDTDKKLAKHIEYRTLYRVFWLNPEPGEGDAYTLKDINKWIADGTWKYLPVKKTSTRKMK